MILEKDIYGVKIFDGIKNQKLYTHASLSKIKETLYDCEKKYHLKGKIELCKNGYHFSPTLDDAHRYKSLFCEEKEYITIKPVCIVKASKGSKIDMSEIFCENTMGNFENSCIKIASSDIEICNAFPFNNLLMYMYGNGFIPERMILDEQNDTIDILNMYSYAYIRDYSEKGITINSPLGYHLNITLFILRRILTEMLTRNIPLKITNKTKYTHYINIVGNNRQYIISIPRFSTKTIDSDVFAKSNYKAIIEHPKNIPIFCPF